MFSLVAFAANSVLCRLALGPGAIDASSFSMIRLTSGALMLWIIVMALKGRGSPASRGTWISAAMLCLYAVAFSFAYVNLATGIGALILFGAVQATMIIAGFRSGERLSTPQWIGLACAGGGLVYLVSPGLTAPSPVGSGLMTLAGVAWGVYSLRGRSSGDPVLATAGNFARAVPLAFAVSLLFLAGVHLSLKGVALAVVSGAVTSGIGYVFWYAALRGLQATRAAVVQLSVPALAAFGGVLFLSEPLTIRLAVAGTVILGGVGLAVLGRKTR
jgi:drug/metabolite transporter (DMT)-like permease